MYNVQGNQELLRCVENLHFYQMKDDCFFLSFRVVGGFETLTAMENVESDPKTDKPKV